MRSLPRSAWAGWARWRPYDVSQDGQRFLGIREGGTDEAVRLQIIVVQNWTEELKQLVPTNRMALNLAPALFRSNHLATR